MSNVAIILAAGQGKRMGAQVNKQYLCLANRPILAHTLAVFESSPVIDGIILVAHRLEVDYCLKEIVAKESAQKVLSVVAGGEQRQDSVYQGLLALPEDCSQVVVHDGARPLVTSELLIQVVDEIRHDLGIICGVPVKDTIKRVDEAQMVVETPPREWLWQVQTPQGFAKEMLLAAYQQAMNEGYYGTDDASLVEHWGGKIKMVMGRYDNLKITTPEDLVMAGQWLLMRK